MKLLKLFFNRFVFITLAILLQMALYVLLLFGLLDYWWFLAIQVVVSTVVFLRVNVRDVNPAQQILWITVILMLPILGSALYLMIGDSKWTKGAKRRLEAIFSKQVTVVNATAELPEKYAGQINYLKTKARTNAYRGCATRYFPTGEKYYEALLEDLKSAEKFIFMEFFIIERGKMWNSILEVLEQKVAEGVEVRVMYDDIGSVTKLPGGYYKKLNKKGIKCIKFNKYRPFVTNLHNNRDHRKIVIIDGKIGYTGGINLADEYINADGRDYYWKDTGVRICGNAVGELAELFMQSYETFSGKKMEFDDYICHQPIGGSDRGVVVPYGTGPAFFYNCPLAEESFLNMINQASREIIITTPYLILDYSLNRALCSAVARGVDVKVVIPDVPDKRIIYLITKNNAEYLYKNGVKIYKADGSFLHAKSIIADGEVAIVGTINFDYRSFIHHFENAVWMYDTDAVYSLHEDVLSLCCDKNYVGDRIRNNLFERLASAVLKIFTPLF